MSPDGSAPELPAVPPTDPSGVSLLRVAGPGLPLDVWLGSAGDHVALEADVRDVSARGLTDRSALAMALGEVAKRHTLEVRVIPRFDPTGPTVLVLFGLRTHRGR